MSVDTVKSFVSFMASDQRQRLFSRENPHSSLQNPPNNLLWKSDMGKFLFEIFITNN